jgi:hypothetical protein
MTVGPLAALENYGPTRAETGERQLQAPAPIITGKVMGRGRGGPGSETLPEPAGEDARATRAGRGCAPGNIRDGVPLGPVLLCGHG